MNGLSTREVRRSGARLLGKRGLSHRNVSRITGKIVEGFREWKRKDLSEIEVVYTGRDEGGSPCGTGISLG